MFHVIKNKLCELQIIYDTDGDYWAYSEHKA